MADDGQSDRQERGVSKSFGLIGKLISGAAVLIVLARVVSPAAFERVDLISVALLLLAILPWLSSILEELKIPGVIETKFRKLESEVEETREYAQELFLTTPESPTNQTTAATTPTYEPERLAQEYMDVRSSMKSGDERTAQMTAIFRKMMNAASRIGKDNYDVRGGLSAGDEGSNLAAIAYIYVYPETAEVRDLIACIERSKQPFIQYWGLKAIHKILSTAGIKAFAPHDIEKLRQLEKIIKPSTDRAFVIDRINRDLDRILS